MKRNLFLGIIGLLFFASCSDDDNITPNESVIQAFNAKYPTASQVKWENKNSYLTAEFTLNTQSNTAWFDHHGQWYMTKTELDHLNQLPEKVQTAFQNSEYVTWTTDDIDCLERSESETLYIIEVKKGELEFDLYYSVDGILIQALSDKDNDYEEYLPDPNVLPAIIKEFIDSKYAGARIIDSEKEYNQTEVDIIHENRSKEVVFDSNNQWVNTHYDVLNNEVPDLVLQALNHSEFKDYRIEDTEKYETPSGNYYLFELEKGETEVEVKIDTEGQLSPIHN